MNDVFWRNACAFAAGATMYPLIELLWRGRTCLSMSATGGVCVLMIFWMNQRLTACGWLLRCLLGAGVITLCELAVGLLINRQHTIWDYSDQPGNLLGQICPRYALYWFLLNIPLQPLCRLLAY